MITILGTFAPNKTFFSYLKRLSDGLFYDDSDGLFKLFSSLVNGKISFVEDSNVPGEYSWSRTIADGEYALFTKQDLGGGNIINAADASLLTIKFGNEISQTNVINNGNDFINIDIVDE